LRIFLLSSGYAVVLFTVYSKGNKLKFTKTGPINLKFIHSCIEAVYYTSNNSTLGNKSLKTKIAKTIMSPILVTKWTKS